MGPSWTGSGVSHANYESQSQSRTYAKVHTCAWDAPEESCAPGDEFCVGDVSAGAEGAKIGAMICFDREFPESARILMLKGDEVVLTRSARELEDDAAAIVDIRIAQL